MTDWYVVLAPVAVLAILALYRFVGCTAFEAAESPASPAPGLPPLPPTGTPCADVVKQTKDIVAYWRLAEASGTQAADQIGAPAGPHPASYTALASALTEETTIHSAAAPGTFTLGQAKLREGGDALTSVLFDGGFAQHAFQAALNPSTFTIEAWVKPNWTQETKPHYHVVFASYEKAPGNKNRGVILQAGPDPVNENAASGPTYWQVRVGTDGAALQTLLGPPVTFGERAHLVVTCDGTKLELWVDLADKNDFNGPSASKTLPAAFAPNKNRPLYIGAGRTDVSGSGTPRFPFKGFIQDVSLYARALTPPEIVRHGCAGDGVM